MKTLLDTRRRSCQFLLEGLNLRTPDPHLITLDITSLTQQSTNTGSEVYNHREQKLRTGENTHFLIIDYKTY